ncbi:hypothetical protein BT93_L0547 [Corymbia citriodora subsp. variegata]|uniref:Uncharacterized protein n=1 Tax=Corymbia citriodora subsp. variegata TaxID=360336 RepID=A0A8T0CX32_CORYI|nr:hypothetical protein BT93_L0547 [Corymbia citriodora subsp. variegata]
MTGLLLTILSLLYILASFSPSDTSAADPLQNPNSQDRRLDGKGRSNIKHSAKFAHGIPHSGYAGGSSHGAGEGRTNGESGSSSPKGGAAVIPIYAGAGANNNHHHSTHHGSGTCIQSRARVHTLTTAVLTLCCVFI